MIMALYFAHQQSLYNTREEQQMLEFLGTLYDVVVINPNTPEHQEKAQRLEKAATYFHQLAASCEHIVFTTFDGKRISADTIATIRHHKDVHGGILCCDEIVAKPESYALKPVHNLNLGDYIFLPEDDTRRFNKLYRNHYRYL
jgi:hypothetical protein